jgi:hypothetical protein
LPNKYKIIDFYREIEATWKVQILEWEYWVFEKTSNYKIWEKPANTYDWLCCTSDRLKTYSKEELMDLWIDISNSEIKKDFDEYIKYVERLEIKILNIKNNLWENVVIFDNLIDEIWKAWKVSEIWTDLSNSWKIKNWIHNQVPLKWIDRIIEKVLAPWFFDWDINRLWDIMRGSLEYDNITELYKWVNGLMEHWMLSEPEVLIFIKDNIWNFQGKARHFQDYRDINCTIKLKDWSLWELQFHIKSILEANNSWIDLHGWTIEKINFTNDELKLSWEWKPNIEIPRNNEWIVWHKIYELWRTIPEGTENKTLLNLKEKLNLLLIEIHKQAWEKQFTK